MEAAARIRKSSLRRSDQSNTASRSAVDSILGDGLAELGLARDRDRLGCLADLVMLLDHWRSRLNLTGHRSAEEIAARLVLDAAALTRALPELDTCRTLADLGSGAGFPGLPIAILFPRLEVCLVESRLKRHHFQREACRQLRLTQVTPLLGRSDAIEIRPSDLIIAQAMTSPQQALSLMAEWTHGTSLLVLPASDGADRPESPAGFEPCTSRTYRIPNTDVTRRLWLSRRLPD